MDGNPFCVWPGSDITFDSCKTTDNDYIVALLYVIQNCEHSIRAYVGEELINSEHESFMEECLIYNNESHLREGTWVIYLALNTTDVLNKWSGNGSVPIRFHAGGYNVTSYLTVVGNCPCCGACKTQTEVAQQHTTSPPMVNVSEEANATTDYEVIPGSIYMEMTISSHNSSPSSGTHDQAVTTTDKSMALSLNIIAYFPAILASLFLPTLI